jgi:hypothetical protein
MKQRAFQRGAGLLRFARNDGEMLAQTSPRHCEELLRRSNPVFLLVGSIITHGQMEFQIPKKLLLGEGLHPLRLSSPGIGERLG